MTLISNAYRPLLVQMVKQFADFALYQMFLCLKGSNESVFLQLDLLDSLGKALFKCF